VLGAVRSLLEPFCGYLSPQTDAPPPRNQSQLSSYYEKGDEALDKFFRSGQDLAKRAGNEAGKAAKVSPDSL
jgi:hypothetical protein